MSNLQTQIKNYLEYCESQKRPDKKHERPTKLIWNNSVPE